MKTSKFLLWFTVACSLLLYFGTHAEFGTVRWVVMSVTLVLHLIVSVILFRHLPSYLPSGAKSEESEGHGESVTSVRELQQ